MTELIGSPMLAFLAWWQWVGLIVLIALIIVYYQMRKQQT